MEWGRAELLQSIPRKISCEVSILREKIKRHRFLRKFNDGSVESDT